MPIRAACRGFTFVLIACSVTLGFPRQAAPKRPWKGYSILGNGNVTAVYSDDSRITSVTGGKGIQHLYFKDYAADYITATSFEVMGQGRDNVPGNARPETGMANFFTTQTVDHLPNGSVSSVRCFVHPGDAVVLTLNLTGSHGGARYRFEARLRAEIKTDTTVRLTSLKDAGGVAIAIWSNGTALAVASQTAGNSSGNRSSNKVIARGSSITVTGSLTQPGSTARILMVPGSSQAEALSKLRSVQEERDLESAANRHWESWMNAGLLPKFQSGGTEAPAYLEAYKRNLYCVKAADLNGRIPADITGQFVTNNMPQLYPRDAMMCARVLLLTGHAPEARQVIEFWANRQIPMKTPGEWYARYDAHGKAVDAGSGARFDEPEWDANGYYIYLLYEYHRLTGVWLADRKLFYELADFLAAHIGSNGLLEEGGIVEWTGYLPASNMICSAALRTAAKMAREFGDESKARSYDAASRQIASSLPQMFDKSRQTYADVRFTSTKGKNGESLPGHSGDKTYLWDTTANVGVIWGYPNHPAMEASNRFYARNTVRLAGGMQYFDSPDPGLASYGHAVFFFTTAAASQYQSLYGNKTSAKAFIDWMIRNANSYGLMPEHINLDESDCSPATPLSWCCAEFASALLLWTRH